MKKKERRMMVATESYMTRDATVYAGVTMVWDDDPVYLSHPQNFRESEHHRPEVEQATSAPGEKRG